MRIRKVGGANFTYFRDNSASFHPIRTVFSSDFLPNRHHAESDVLGAHVVRALHLVDLIRLGHYDAVMLQHDGVAVDSDLESERCVNTRIRRSERK